MEGPFFSLLPSLSFFLLSQCLSPSFSSSSLSLELFPLISLLLCYLFLFCLTTFLFLSTLISVVVATCDSGNVNGASSLASLHSFFLVVASAYFCNNTFTFFLSPSCECAFEVGLSFLSVLRCNLYDNLTSEEDIEIPNKQSWEIRLGARCQGKDWYWQQEMGTWWKRRCCSSSIYASPSTPPSVALIPLSILLPPKAITKLMRCCSRMVPASILGTTAVRMSNASDSPVRQTREQLHHHDKPSPVKQLRDHIIHQDN